MIQKSNIKKTWPGLLLAIIIGSLSYQLKSAIGSPLLDPLLIALIIGIIIRSIIGNNSRLIPGFNFASAIFIPIGVVFYGAISLDFIKFSKIDIKYSILLLAIIFVYFMIILLLGKILKQKKQITYLTATGSAICGASAITITSRGVNADPDDISISLLSVFITAIFGLFILFPFLANFFNMTDQVYALFAGSILQFSGFVKAAAGGLDQEFLNLATSIKTFRYLGLLIALPLFASLIRKKIYFPWFLWAFLGAGLLFSFAPVVAKIFTPSFEVIQVLFWSIAMAAIGLNANIQALLSDNGVKALLMSFVGFYYFFLVFIFYNIFYFFKNFSQPSTIQKKTTKIYPRGIFTKRGCKN